MPSLSNDTVSCIIIDDEPLARDVIRRYIRKTPYLRLLGEFGNGIDGMIYLHKEQVDLIFLDIRMPQLSGMEFIKSIRQHPKIIITTAHREYAFDGFELDVSDYLLKPIRFDRFLRSVNKAFPQVSAAPSSPAEAPKPATPSQSFIYIRVDRKMIKVYLDQILYIESDKDYVKIVMENSCLTTRQTISSIEAMLSDTDFLRIHRSFIVSLNKIRSFTADSVEIGNKELPVGKLYRQQFMKLQQT